MFRPRISTSAPQDTLDDLVTRNVVTMLKFARPNLAAQAGLAPPSQELVPHLVCKVMQLEADNTKLQQQLQRHQPPRQDVQDSRTSQAQLQLQEHQSLDCQQQQQQQAQQIEHLQLELQRLRQQCKAAWEQVADMKQFLNDYGLVWVGETEQTYHNLSPTSTAPAPAAAAECCRVCTGLPFDLSELQECLDELKQVAGEGIARFLQVGSGTITSTVGAGGTRTNANRTMQLYIPEAVNLAVYKDGLQLHTAPAMPYASATADAILADIFDGYFPSVLKREFPEGTPIQMVDKTRMTLAEAEAASVAARATNTKGFQDLELKQQQGLLPAPMTADDFLCKLPTAVIRNQQVVPVRSVVADYIGTSSSSSSGAAGFGKVYIRPASSSRNGSSAAATSVGAAETEAASDNSDTGAATVVSGQEIGQQKYTTIQVKSENGKQTYVLKLPFLATIAALRSSIDSHRATSGFKCEVCQPTTHSGVSGDFVVASSPPAVATVAATAAALSTTTTGQEQAPFCAAVTPAGCSYELRSSFPARVYNDNSLSLEAAGLTPSATLFMRHC